MTYKIAVLTIMAVFYLIYIYKLVSLNSKNIKTNQAGIGNKSKKVKITERVMSAANVLEIIAQVLSVILVESISCFYLKIIGIVLGVLSVVFFFLATYTMKNNWRVGIPEEKTSLVNNGIYKISRNPAFVGFDLLYICTTIVFFNIPLLVITIFSIITLHLQILQEEKHMEKMFGEEFIEYKKHTCRYIGRKIV